MVSVPAAPSIRRPHPSVAPVFGQLRHKPRIHADKGTASGEPSSQYKYDPQELIRHACREGRACVPIPPRLLLFSQRAPVESSRLGNRDLELTRSIDAAPADSRVAEQEAGTDAGVNAVNTAPVRGGRRWVRRRSSMLVRSHLRPPSCSTISSGLSHERKAERRVESPYVGNRCPSRSTMCTYSRVSARCM